SMASKTERRKACTPTPRDATTFTMLVPVLAVMARKVSRLGGGFGRVFVSRAFSFFRVRTYTRKIFLLGGHQGGRMEHLGAKIGQFGGLVEADLPDGPGSRAEPGVGGHHAFHVGPDFDLIGIESRAEDGSRIIRPSAAEGGGNSLTGGRDKTA